LKIIFIIGDKTINAETTENLLLEIQKMLSVLIKNLKSKTYDLKPKNGFTVVEMLVATTLFVVVISIATGVFVRSLRAQRILTALLAANSNASTAIELLAREVRTGINFCTDTPCESGSEPNEFATLTFTNARGEAVLYRKEIRALPSGATINSLIKSIDGGAAQPLTADTVDVTHLSFYLLGNALGDNRIPRITISIGISAPYTPLEGSAITFQTTVSTRLQND